MLREGTTRLCLLLSLSVALCEAVLEVQVLLGEDCVLRCTAEDKPGVEYLSVRWYKEGPPPASRLLGVLTRYLPNGTVVRYRSTQREAELHGESRDLRLPNATCDDAGYYTCDLAAPVGEQNREGRVLLTTTGCPAHNPAENRLTDTCLVVLATLGLILALVIFLISYVILKNVLRDRNRTLTKETFLDAPLDPLNEEDLRSIYTLGPKGSYRVLKGPSFFV
ncbi:CD83 antigen [Pungitius pungitius]|uniref:CD83 antigen n=1 Tax=Pungitius pungitius TaxID=134920 RepID=UPI002E1139D3